MSHSCFRNSIIALFLVLLPLFLYQSALAAEIKLAWDPPPDDVTGYSVYYGTSARTGTDPNSCGLCGYLDRVNAGNVTTYNLTGLTLGQTYFISLTAYNASGESSFSNEVSGAAYDSETVSTPGMLSGPTTGMTWTLYTYTTGGSSSNLGHSVEYQFDWGDGTNSGWLPVGTTSGSKSWTSAGTYFVRAQARCATHTSVVSGWSGALAVSISINPNAPLFSDVPFGYWAYDYISAIYNAHFTTGCAQNPLKYCPENNVTRGQMAAFVVRAKFGENFSYTTTPYFSDVPATHLFFKYVQKLKDSNITVVSGTYGVDDFVTRGQVAAFIVRAKFGENFSYTTTPYFSDVPATHLFFKYVQKLRDSNITVVSGTYGVDHIPTRAQMAAFLSRAFLGAQ